MSSPPFCPIRSCPYHWPERSRMRGWWRKAGHYRCARAGRVQRFQCLHCLHRFSETSFSIDYFAKRPVDYHRLVGLVVNAASVRATARQLRISPQAVNNRVLRVARQALALHARELARMRLNEPLVADGLESFWVSQYFPTNLNVLVGARSQFVYALTTATLRRSGRMTAAQKARRAELERQDPPASGELSRRFTELLASAHSLWRRSAKGIRSLITDEHTGYPRCLAALPPLAGLTHLRISSRRARTVTNPLFPVNYIDREIRKDLAEHRRETVCFARSAAMSIARMWIYIGYHNYRKPYRVGIRCSETHAERAGVAPEALSGPLRHWLTRRALFSHTAMPPAMVRAWCGAEHTPLSADLINRRITPRYCFD